MPGRFIGAPPRTAAGAIVSVVLTALGAIERRLAVLEAALVEPRGDHADGVDSGG